MVNVRVCQGLRQVVNTVILVECLRSVPFLDRIQVCCKRKCRKTQFDLLLFDAF